METEAAAARREAEGATNSFLLPSFSSHLYLLFSFSLSFIFSRLELLLKVQTAEVDAKSSRIAVVFYSSHFHFVFPLCTNPLSFLVPEIISFLSYHALTYYTYYYVLTTQFSSTAVFIFSRKKAQLRLRSSFSS